MKAVALLRGWRTPALRRPRRVRSPTVLQMEAVECGAAAVAIMLAYFGRYVALEELRVACGISRDGSKASNLLKAARTYGLDAHGARFDLDELRRQTLPCIVFWNFNHFLVVDSFAPGCVQLNDPACGARQVSEEEFSRSYTGIALMMKRGADFVAGGERRTLMATLRQRLQGARPALSYVVLASLALVLPGLALPVFAQVFVDNILVERMDSWIKPLLLGLALTAILRTWLTWLQQSQLLRLEIRLALSSSAIFFWHVLRLPIEFFHQRHAGDISQRVLANDRIAHVLAGELATNAVSLVTVIFYLLIMLQIDAFLTLVGVTLTALNLLALRRIYRLRKAGNIKLQHDRARLMSTTMGGIQTIETIKASGAEAEFFLRWSGYKTRVANTTLRLELSTRGLAVLPGLLNAMLVVIILGLGGKRVIEGAMSLGMLVAFQSLMSSFTQPVAALFGLSATLQEAGGDLTRQDDVLRTPLDLRFTAAPELGAQPAPPLQGALELRDIRFGYSRLEPPLIEHFDLRLAPGQRIALVGGSGSGKSTIARIVMGLNQPWSGAVLIDGVTRDELPREVVRAVLGGVDQESYLFAGTVRENLSLWDQTLPEADLLRAAHDACLHDLIAARSHGYDTPVGEGGANFSGGQAQRIEIARALASNPRILVLDEATAALDPATEKRIDDNIRRRGCACLVVAHRLSTIRDCDEIIVMQAGKVVERGTHASLMMQDGAYRRLIAAEA